MGTVNNIWAQDCVRFEVVHTETLRGGDLDAVPLGNFPGAEDTDLNGDGVFQPALISSMHTINLSERQTLQQIARRRMTAAGEDPDAILLFFVRSFTSGEQGLTTLNGQRVMVSGDNGNTRANVTAHELGHALNIEGDFEDFPPNGTPDNPNTEVDETRHTELMSTPGGPDPRDLSTDDAVSARTRADNYPQ